MESDDPTYILLNLSRCAGGFRRLGLLTHVPLAHLVEWASGGRRPSPYEWRRLRNFASLHGAPITAWPRGAEDDGALDAHLMVVRPGKYPLDALRAAAAAERGARAG